jgi:hypothetical protein
MRSGPLDRVLLAVSLGCACAPTPRYAAPRPAAPAVLPRAAARQTVAPDAALPDRSWLLDPSTKVVTLTEERRFGYGADFVAISVELVVRPGVDAQGIIKEVTLSSRGRASRARPVTVSRRVVEALMKSLHQASPGTASRPGQVIVDRSDHVHRTEIRVRSESLARSLQVFSASHGRSPRRWQLRSRDGVVELDGCELERRVVPLLMY